jgi:ketosteroid isomerase-like protein
MRRKTMTSEQERMAHDATVSAWVKALEADDVSGYLDCFASEVECEDIALQAKAAGKEELGKGIAKWLAVLHHERVQVDLQLEGDGHTAVIWTVTIVVRDQIPGVPDRIKVGSRAIIHGVSIFRFGKNSKFTWERSYWDLSELLRQVRD